jgi:hypothetical protein
MPQYPLRSVVMISVAEWVLPSSQVKQSSSAGVLPLLTT